MSSTSPAVHLEPHFEDISKQTHAARLGMWVFIGSEALLFSALFALYAAYRVAYPGAVEDAAGRSDGALGTIMTGVLRASSFLGAMSLGRVRRRLVRDAARFLVGATVLGVAFLALKGMEYAEHFRD